MKKIPQRTCVGCNTQKNKSDFIRIVKSKEGNITIDKTGKASGRGAYICNSVECLLKAKKSKKLERVFEVGLDDKIYYELEEILLKKE